VPGLAILLALFLVEAPALAQSPNYTDVNQIEAARALEKVAGKPLSGKAGEAEQVEWVRARMAWIALERLQGQEEKALKIFAGCGGYCERHSPEKEWKALRTWACAKSPKAAPCGAKAQKAKAQKPPR
jgi:hypothetical protein